MTKQNIFISHSTKNDTQVNRIADTLEDAGFEVWVDHRNGIEPGTPSWDKAIRQAIDVADAGLFVMSEDSLDSDICGSECLLVRELDDPLYVLKLEEVKPVNVWLYIKQIQYADISIDYDAGMDSLIRALNGETAPDAPTAIRSKFTGESTLRRYLPYLFVNPMHGRDNDLDQLSKSLNGVVQVTGTGGLGKSRLVAEVALKHEIGAVWYRCSAISSPADLLGLLMTHLRLSNDSTEADVLQQLKLRHGTLIVLDNAEDVPPDHRSRYKTLIAKLQSAGAHVVLTSRVRWNIRPIKEITPSALTLDHAIAITQDFAEADDIDLSREDAQAIAEASRLYPRLIEWAIGQLNRRPLRRVLKQLDDLTSRGVQDALYEMINRSLEQMSEQEGDHPEKLLLRLVTCVGTVDYDAVLALKPDALDEDDMDDALDVLQAWRFVRYDNSEERYSVDAMVRLALPTPDQSAHRAHFEHYHSLHSDYDANQSYNDAGEYARHNLLAQDWDNILVAIEWGFDNEAKQTVDWVRTLQNFMLIRRTHEERIDLLEETLTHANTIDYTQGHAHTLYSLGEVHRMTNQYDDAVAHYQQALPIYQSIGDQLGHANTLKALGDVHRMTNQYDDAVAHYQQALPIYQSIGARLGHAHTLIALGDVHRMTNQYDDAVAHYQQALTLYQTIGDRLGHANTLTALGDVHRMTNQYDEAVAHYQQALTLYQSIGYRLGHAHTLKALGDVHRMTNQYDDAVAHYQQALTIYQSIGDRLGHANTLYSLGEVHRMTNQYDDAVAHYQQALKLGEQIGNFTSQLNSLKGLAFTYQAQDDLENACRYAKDFLALASTHPFFRDHPLTQRKREEFAEWGCEGV